VYYSKLPYNVIARPEAREKMSQNVKSFFQPQAAKKMAEQIVNLQYENNEE
jgi:UDP-N-acetylglucosamine:LPS N-acetylglucosamine transferase